MRVGIDRLNLVDGSVIEFSKENEFFIITGANNSGKTRFLLECYQSLNENIVNPSCIVQSCRLFKMGTHEELIRRLKDIGIWDGTRWIFPNLNFSGNLEGFFSVSGMSSLEKVLCLQLTTSRRLSLTNPPNSIDFHNEPKSHPLHYLHRDAEKRRLLSRYFKRAFGTEIAMDLIGSKVVPLHVGNGAEVQSGESPVDDDYLSRLRALPRLEDQGDGMKSFVGILLNILFGQNDIVFLDEPEAFLHPPQARLLGNILGKERPKNVQLIVATHSADFIRGALESADPLLRISRISREGNIGQITQLAKDDIKQSWSDPVLRFSNIIEGLFHERVVICEADGDCRFYAAIAEALRSTDNHPYIRDLMFAQAGGKGGIPKLVSALKCVAVPTIAVVDFDIFRQPGQLNSLISSLGGEPASYHDEVAKVRENINEIGTRPTALAAKKEIIEILEAIDDSADEIPRPIEKKLKDAVRSPPGWARAKTTGLGMLDRNIRGIGQCLLARLKEIGLFVVPVGEIESFETNETASKNEWVDAVLTAHQNDMIDASSLYAAREFVAGLIATRA